jgi:putative NADPH-quinone reductase
MSKRIVIIQGHPDSSGHHLLHALSDAYAEGATAAGHDVRGIEVAKLDFPLLRTQVEFETGALPPALVQPRDDMRWAEHWVFLFPLWHGTMPALFKGFLEHIFRPGFAMEYKKGRVPQATARRPLGAHRRDHGNAGAAVSLVLWRIRSPWFRAQYVELRRDQADPREPVRAHLCRREETCPLDRGHARIWWARELTGAWEVYAHFC